MRNWEIKFSAVSESQSKLSHRIVVLKNGTREGNANAVQSHLEEGQDEQGKWHI